jgi:hypothetical protein
LGTVRWYDIGDKHTAAVGRKKRRARHVPAHLPGRAHRLADMRERRSLTQRELRSQINGCELPRR